MTNDFFSDLTGACVEIAEDVCRNRKKSPVLGGAALLAAACLVWERHGRSKGDVAAFLRDEALKLETFESAGATATAT